MTKGVFLIFQEVFCLSFPKGLGLEILVCEEHIEWKRRAPLVDVWDFQISRKIEPMVNIVVLYIDLCIRVRTVIFWFRLDFRVTNTTVKFEDYRS